MAFENKKIIVNKSANLDYLLYKPEGYEPSKKTPLVISLHGSGERGNDLEKLKRYGILSVLNKGKKIPFLVVSPQCPENELWEMQFHSISHLIEEVIKEYNVDENRIYLTGYSMGGYATWHYAMLNPEKFAAIVPIAGGCMYPKRTISLRKIPVWVSHGGIDMEVPISESEEVVNFLSKFNRMVIFNTYDNMGHEVCSSAYEDPILFDWMLDKSK